MAYSYYTYTFTFLFLVLATYTFLTIYTVFYNKCVFGYRLSKTFHVLFVVSYIFIFLVVFGLWIIDESARMVAQGIVLAIEWGAFDLEQEDIIMEKKDSSSGQNNYRSQTSFSAENDFSAPCPKEKNQSYLGTMAKQFFDKRCLKTLNEDNTEMREKVVKSFLYTQQGSCEGPFTWDEVQKNNPDVTFTETPIASSIVGSDDSKYIKVNFSESYKAYNEIGNVDNNHFLNRMKTDLIYKVLNLAGYNEELCVRTDPSIAKINSIRSDTSFPPSPGSVPEDGFASIHNEISKISRFSHIADVLKFSIKCYKLYFYILYIF